MTKPYPSPRFLEVVVKSRNSVEKVGLSGIMYAQETRVSLTGDRGSVLKILYLVGKTNKQNHTASLIVLYGIFQKKQLFAYVSANNDEKS